MHPSREQPERTDAAGTLDATLREIGVLLLSPRRRAEVVATLVAEGSTAEDLRAVWSYIAESEPDVGTARRYLGALLTSAEQRAKAFADVRAYLAQRAAAPQAFGEALRRRDVAKVREFDREYETWVAAKKAAGEWPPRRDPHPWELRREACSS